MIHSITRPPELRYKDLLEDINEDSREIDRLAASGTRAEIRGMNLKLDGILLKLDSFHSLHSSSLIDTNQRLTDLQFSQVMSYVSGGKLGDHLKSYRFNHALQIRHKQSRTFETTNRFWISTKLHNWSSMTGSKVAVVKGGFRARFVLRSFSVDIIQQLQSKDVPVLWALRGPENDSEGGKISPVDVFKHLIHQALCIGQESATESGMSLQCARFQRAATEHEWLQLLGAALTQRGPQVYVVIDLSTLDNDLLPANGFSWLTAFQQLFDEMAKRSQNMQIKVLLLGDRVSSGTQEQQPIPSDIVIPVRVSQTPVRRRKQMNRSAGGYWQRDHRRR